MPTAETEEQKKTRKAAELQAAKKLAEREATATEEREALAAIKKGEVPKVKGLDGVTQEEVQEKLKTQKLKPSDAVLAFTKNKNDAFSKMLGPLVAAAVRGQGTKSGALMLLLAGPVGIALLIPLAIARGLKNRSEGKGFFGTNILLRNPAPSDSEAKAALDALRKEHNKPAGKPPLSQAKQNGTAEPPVAAANTPPATPLSTTNNPTAPPVTPTDPNAASTPRPGST